MYNIHQNFLIILKIASSRVVGKYPGHQNSWQRKITEVINLRMHKKIKTHEETTTMLKVYCSNSENIFKNIARANQSKRIFKVISDWLNQIQKVPVDRIREVL